MKNSKLLRWTRDRVHEFRWSPNETVDRLVLNPALKDRLSLLAGRFRESRDSYAKQELAWRLGLFIYGPPGTGKSAAAKAIARLLDWDCVVIPGHEILDSHFFESAMAFASQHENRVIILEGIDEMTRRMELADFFTVLDEALLRADGTVWIATSRHPELVPKTQLLRPSRLEETIRLDLPSGELRRTLLEKILGGEVLSASELDELTEASEGLSFSHLEEIRQLAARASLNSAGNSLGNSLGNSAGNSVGAAGVGGSSAGSATATSLADIARFYIQDQVIAGDRLGGASDTQLEVEERVKNIDPRVLKSALDMTDVFRTLMEKTIADAAEQAREEGSAG